MLGIFVATVSILLGSVEMSFQQGQENPQAGSFIESKAKSFVDDRAYGVDEIGN